MKKIISAFMTCVLTITASCSSPEKIEEAKLKQGEYKVKITQTVDLDSFTITREVVGGNAIDKGIIDALTNEYKGFAYAFTDEENYRSSYSYKTTKDGAWITCNIALVGGNSSKNVKIKGEIFLNNKLLGRKENTYNGGEKIESYSIQSIDFQTD